MNKFPLRIRKYQSESDLNFVTSSWIKHLSQHIRDMSSYWFAAAQNALIKEILNKDSVTCLVAVSPDNETQIYGYIVAEDILLPDTPAKSLLHFAYVKSSFRQCGVFSRLLGMHAAAGDTVFHSIKAPAPTTKYEWVYCPQLLTATGIKRIRLLRSLGEKYGQDVSIEEPAATVRPGQANPGVAG